MSTHRESALSGPTVSAGSDADADSLLAGFDAIDHAIAIWSKQGGLRYRNAAAAGFFEACGAGSGDGLTIVDWLRALVASGRVILPQDEKAWLQAELGLFAVGGSSEYTCVDGRVLRNERWSMPDGGVAMVVRDISLEKRYEASLEKARSEADQSDRKKSRFLRAANHDLRQPLATLKILIYNCMMTEEEEHRSDLLHAMDISVSIMEDLLGALLNIGQLDAGQVKPRITTFQLSTLLERMDIEFGHQAREKALDFRVVQSRYTVVSDRALLERIVSNLIANAIRYTDRGAILIGCRRLHGRIRLEVRDSGVGIASEDCEAIFEEFYRVEGPRKRKGALGLGLSIAKRIADILEHPLEVRSEPGVGSIFSIDLPVGDILRSDIGEPEISEKVGGEFVGLSILVLEDDEILRVALIELLERWGIKVQAFNAFDDLAASLREKAFRPDLIISDYRLHGGLNGDAIVREVRTQLELDAPAIIVTADTDPRLIETIREGGFPVLIKPVSPPRLRVMMHNILYEPELVRELRPKDPELAGARS